MTKRRPPDGMKWCGACKKDRPVGQFLTVPRGWKVTFCNTCAGKKMAEWRKQNNVGKKAPDSFIG